MNWFNVSFALALLGLSVAPEAVASPDDPRHIQGRPRHHDGIFYGAVWSASAPESAIQKGHEPGDLEAIEEGFHLVDVEVTLELGQRHYTGLFHADGGGESVLGSGFDAAGFQVENRRNQGEGRCLSGFEAWRENQTTLYAGVWRQGCVGGESPDLLELDLDRKEFVQAVYENGSTYHLVDLETVVVDGQLRASGLWRAGADAEPAWVLLGVSWHTFHEQAHDMKPDGYQLRDLEAQRKPQVNACGAAKPEPDDPDEGYVLSGFWRVGKEADWLGLDFRWNQLDCAARRLDQGHTASGVLTFGESVCDQINEEKQAPPNGDKLRLVAIEGYSGVIPSLCHEAVHSGVLHDSGTAGEP